MDKTYLFIYIVCRVIADDDADAAVPFCAAVDVFGFGLFDLCLTMHFLPILANSASSRFPVTHAHF